MAILWSLCKKTTTFWREVRTMAIILRLLQVCSSLLLVRMLALPYPAHIVLPLPLPLQPTRPQPSWRDAHTHMYTQREREGGKKPHTHSLTRRRTQLSMHPRFVTYTHAHTINIVSAASVCFLPPSLSLSLYKQSLTQLLACTHTCARWCKRAGQDETLTFSSTRTFTRAPRPQSQKRIKQITRDGTLQSQESDREEGNDEEEEETKKKKKINGERKSAKCWQRWEGRERGRHELHWTRREAVRTRLTFYCCRSGEEKEREGVTERERAGGRERERERNRVRD